MSNISQIAHSPNSEYIAGLAVNGTAFIWKSRTLALVRLLDSKALAPLWRHSLDANSRGLSNLNLNLLNLRSCNWNNMVG